MSSSLKAWRPESHQWLFTWKNHDFLDTGEYMYDPIINQDCEPSAEGATFRLHALYGSLLGLSFLQIPRSCSEPPHRCSGPGWFVPQDQASCC